MQTIHAVCVCSTTMLLVNAFITITFLFFQRTVIHKTPHTFYPASHKVAYVTIVSLPSANTLTFSAQ